MSGLGRLVPPDDEHVRKYALLDLSAAEQPKAVPVVIGINWYERFDEPVKISGRWQIVDKPGGLGAVRGGHAICVPSQHQSDRDNWRLFYNQGDTGECVGFSSSRMMSLLNRELYDAPWLYFSCQDLDGEPRDPDAGTLVRLAGQVLKTTGPKDAKALKPSIADGISAYRWATTVDEMRAVLQSPIHDRYQAFPLLNSWGRDYPHVVWMPYSVAERVVMGEDGECMVVTDR